MTILPGGILFTHSLRSAGVALLFASLACAQTGPAGHWEGVLGAENNHDIGVTLDLAKNAKSEWIASMGIPAGNLTGMVVADVVVNGDALKFVAKAAQILDQLLQTRPATGGAALERQGLHRGGVRR